LLEGIASAVRWFEWAEAPHKGTPRTIQP
jgi:hypothetical protein